MVASVWLVAQVPAFIWAGGQGGSKLVRKKTARLTGHVFDTKNPFGGLLQADQEINGIKHFRFVYSFTPPHEWRDQKKS
ncbi:MAG: hypothetical protein EA401_04100 [Planctomycetota bacterium]|nr:MAG: hypothetical protein EA401_04100 [Planctomycetota bacterium]